MAADRGAPEGAGHAGYILSGTVVMPHATLAGGCVVTVGGRIAYVGAEEALPAELPAPDGTTVPAATLTRLSVPGGYVAPGFIDLHVHGGGGADVMDGTPEALRQMAATHARHGTTGFLATTVTAPQQALVRAAEAVVACARQGAGEGWAGARVLGLHLEGPYINPKKKGAQNPEHMRPLDRRELEELLEILGEQFRLITLAPEMPGGLEAIPWLRARGVRVSLGHTDATYEQFLAAVAAGAHHATHTYNAMNGLHHRDPGGVGAILTDDRVMAELICDTVHVHPAAMNVLYRCKGPDRICLVTDAIRAVGLPEGEYELGGLPVYVRGGAARLADGTLAGSVLTMERAVRHAVRDVGVPLVEAVRMASLNPAREIGLADRKGSLEAGKDADVVLLDAELEVVAVLVEGRLVYRRDEA